MGASIHKSKLACYPILCLIVIPLYFSILLLLSSSAGLAYFVIFMFLLIIVFVVILVFLFFYNLLLLLVIFRFLLFLVVIVIKVFLLSFIVFSARHKALPMPNKKTCFKTVGWYFWCRFYNFSLFLRVTKFRRFVTKYSKW